MSNHSIIGTNLGGLSYWTTELAFVNAMRMSSQWISLNKPGLQAYNPWGNGMPINLRPDGYPAFLLPGQMLVKLILRDVQLHAPRGRYVCLYDGDGVINFSFDAKLLTSAKGRIEFEFNPTWLVGCTAVYCNDNGILLQLLETNVLNPVRNIRIIMPGFESQNDNFPFHPWFLKNLQRYSTIRFMTWQNINSNNEVFWSNRTTPSSDSFSNGVALEYMIQLSNTLGSNPWFCIPHMANDEYVRNFALLVKSQLRNDLKVLYLF
jgi:hypothetical protein